MRKPIKFLFLVSLFASCASRDRKGETQKQGSPSEVDTLTRNMASRAHVAPDNQNSGTDTLIVKDVAAVFYYPDSSQIEKQIKKIGEENFRIGADDYAQAVHESDEYLEQQKMPVIQAESKKYLKFIMADNSVQLIKLDTLPDLWGLYLFDPAKQPYEADMTIIEEEYKNYFQNHPIKKP